LKQNVRETVPFKFGISQDDCWAAYINNNVMFVKKYSADEDADYPDHGSTFEVYTNELFMEIETLSPLYMVNLEEEICHVETEQFRSTSEKQHKKA